MSDPVSLARAARENLARGLAALQSPTVPPQVMAVAEPIAHAMSALHHVEATRGAASSQAGPAALNAARHALAMLQQHPPGHAAVEQAMEAIAGSLSLIHQLSQTPAPAPAPQPAAAFAGTVAMPPLQQAAPATQPSPQPAYQQAAQAPAPGVGGAGAPLRLEAELGAHSTTNFYKGLSGNDVIDSGGLFIATYQIPPIGRNVSVKVSMPGGYEFEALGIVRWTREAPLSGSDSPPGFGAQFTQITPEGRQLVYRYVRNREPLFHDDL